jgi:hypothetical protein
MMFEVPLEECPDYDRLLKENVFGTLVMGHYCHFWEYNKRWKKGWWSYKGLVAQEWKHPNLKFCPGNGLRGDVRKGKR